MMTGRIGLYVMGRAMLLSENGIRLIKPHPYKQIGRRLFSAIALLNLCFWSIVAACNFLFNLSFEDRLYDLCLFVVFAVIHVVFMRKIICKLYRIPYGNIALTRKDEFTYTFRIKLLGILLAIFVIAFAAISAAAFGIAYVTYILHNNRITELDFVLRSWSLVYSFAIASAYASCMIVSRFFLLAKFDIHHIKNDPEPVSNVIKL
jgi:hypothetical protein